MRFRISIFTAIIAIAATAFLTTREAPAHVRITTDLNWSEDIRPIVRKHCMSCHSPGGIAPNYVDLTTYGNKPGESGARDWAKAIEEEIMTGRMPPWRPDERFGTFENDRRITQDELDYLIAWIQGGAPQGPRRNLPAPEEFTKRDWLFGQPDYVVELPAPATIPAEPKEFLYTAKIPVEIEEDQWITGYEFFPGTPSIVHTVIAMIHDPEGAEPEVLEIEIKKEYDPLADEDDLEEIGTRTTAQGPHYLGQWVRGDVPVLLPDEAGRRLRKGSSIELQITYRKLSYEDEGKGFEDASKLGLFFATETVDLIVQSFKIENDDFTIPADEKHFEASVSFEIEESSHLIGLHPHMGFLGKDLRINATYPDGISKTLLWIPEFNQKFSSSYILATPIPAPAGTRLDLIGHYDNSSSNFENPNYPPKDVSAGEAPGNERLVAWIDTTLGDHLYVPAPTPTPRPVEESSDSGMGSLNFSDSDSVTDGTTLPPDIQMNNLGGIFGVDQTAEEVMAEQLAQANAERQEQAQAAAEADPTQEIYWCPMRGTAEGQCGLHDFDAPGKCDVCGMTLKPKSFFIERYGDKVASGTPTWNLTAPGTEDVFWCPNRGNVDHELTDYAERGVCPIDGEILVHRARFEDTKTWVCLTDACPDREKRYYSPGVCPTCGEPVQSMGHMDHTPLHGGQFIMADNLFHHIEGTLPANDVFRLYFYNDWKKPIDPRNFAGTVFIETFDEESEEIIEETFDLIYKEEGDAFLTAAITAIEEFPADFSAEVFLAGEKTIFSFAFEELTPEVDPNAEAQNIRLHKHAEAGELVIPESSEEKAREIFLRDAIVQDRIASEDWFGLHEPALQAKEIADALALNPGDLGPRDRGKLHKAVGRITQGGIFLDRAGDASDGPRVQKAYATFAEGIALLREIYPE